MAASAASSGENLAPKQLAESVKRFSRSIELCDDYLRGYYGLKLVGAPLYRPSGAAQLTTSLRLPTSYSPIRQRSRGGTRRMGWSFPAPPRSRS